MDEVYAHLAVRVFATSMIGIFIPIYLYTLGFSLIDISVFMLYSYAIALLLSPLSCILSRRLGCAKQMVLLAPLQGLYYLLLISLPSQPELLIPSALAGGVALTVYWMPLNAIVVSSLSPRKEGKQIAYVMALPRLISVLAPTAAGILLTAIGFSSFFALAIVLIAISVLPLFASPDQRFPYSFSFTLPRKIGVQQAVAGVIDISETIVWPLWMFQQLNDLVSVGIAASLMGMGVLVFTALLGGISDKFSKHSTMQLAGICYGGVWIARAFFPDVSSIYILSFLGGASLTLLETTIFPQFSDVARGKHLLDRLVHREFWLVAGRILGIAIIIGTGSLPLAFLFAAMACLFLLVV